HQKTFQAPMGRRPGTTAWELEVSWRGRASRCGIPRQSLGTSLKLLKMDTERNLLFGVVALQEGAISAGQFSQAITSCLERPDASLADVLVERGWLTL